MNAFTRRFLEVIVASVPLHLVASHLVRTAQDKISLDFWQSLIFALPYTVALLIGGVLMNVVGYWPLLRAMRQSPGRPKPFTVYRHFTIAYSFLTMIAAGISFGLAVLVFLEIIERSIEDIAVVGLILVGFPVSGFVFGSIGVLIVETGFWLKIRNPNP